MQVIRFPRPGERYDGQCYVDSRLGAPAQQTLDRVDERCDELVCELARAGIDVRSASGPGDLVVVEIRAWDVDPFVNIVAQPDCGIDSIFNRAVETYSTRPSGRPEGEKRVWRYEAYPIDLAQTCRWNELEFRILISLPSSDLDEVLQCVRSYNERNRCEP